MYFHLRIPNTMRLNIDKYLLPLLCMLLLSGIPANGRAAALSDGAEVSLKWDFSAGTIRMEDAVFSPEFAGLPAFSAVVETGGNSAVSLAVEGESYTNISRNLLSAAQLELIGNQVAVQTFVAKARNEQVVSVVLLPFRWQDGQLQVLTSFRLKINESPTIAARFSGTSLRTYAGNSVLRSGKWFKLGVSSAGVYKLDYTFLKNLGVNVDAINPANLRIFGHRAGMLPELAGSEREDEVREIPLKVVAANPTRLQSGDYILAYLPGPEKWTYDVGRQFFAPQKHLYSDTKSFFLTTDAGTGARVGSISSVALPPNKFATTYDACAFYEDDIINIAQSGKQFLGDLFGSITDKSYPFNIPNLIASEPVKINIAVAAAAQTFGSSFTMTTDNGANSRSIPVPVVAEAYPGIFNTASRVERLFTVNNISPSFQVNLNYNRNGDFSTRGWLDFIQVNAKATLRYEGQPLYFRNIASAGAGSITTFTVQNVNPNVEIWNVTNPFDVRRINYTLSGSNAVFTLATDSLLEFAAFENSNAVPVAQGSIANQDLHALPQQDMLIVTREAYVSSAQILAQFHREKQGLKVAVVTLEQVYNEFSSGTNDITAIRNFAKMFYDRAGGNPAQMPRYLLLFGDGTYDNKKLGNNLMPTYQTTKTYETLETYVSDDYFGMLDDNEGANITNTAAEKEDIAVGRIPADDQSKAMVAVEKILRYASAAGYGEWRNQGTFIADDEDFNIHIQDANGFADNYGAAEKKSNVDKIFLDAYNQVSAAGGATYPAANEALNRKVFTGSLFMNYVGHGGPMGLTAERLLLVEDISSWTNTNKLPLFITATCEFAPYDKPDEFTAGERVFFKENGGGIALVTTTRIVYSNRNKTMNENFMEQMVNAYADRDMTLGDIMREAKKNTNTFDGNRKFTLLGDPALRLAFPTYNVVATAINGKPIAAQNDTLKALSKITIEGEVRDNSNQRINNFNGTASVTIYDKSKTIRTLQNDPDSYPYEFQLQKNTIYKGKTKVTNGVFSCTFLVPKDIDYNFGLGKISMYAYNDTADAAGYSSAVIVGGASDSIPLDNEGPVVDVFMNDEKFVLGGITDENPLLLVKLFDVNGINTSGNGIGHDITAIIDNDTRNVFTLNDFYETEVDDIANGTVQYPFSRLSKGRHTLEVKAWDVLNNSGVGYTEFIVAEKANLALSHVLNYPNPFTTHTRFMFEHNRPGEPLDMRIEIFTVSGKVVKTIQQTINTAGFRVDDISWDGLDDYGDKIGKGVYIYRITLKDEAGKKVSEYQKLVILN